MNNTLSNTTCCSSHTTKSLQQSHTVMRLYCLNEYCLTSTFLPLDSTVQGHHNVTMVQLTMNVLILNDTSCSAVSDVITGIWVSLNNPRMVTTVLIQNTSWSRADSLTDRQDVESRYKLWQWEAVRGQRLLNLCQHSSHVNSDIIKSLNPYRSPNKDDLMASSKQRTLY